MVLVAALCRACLARERLLEHGDPFHIRLAVARVRFAPSPTGSLHLGSALTAIANRTFADEKGGVMILRIDDTDAARTEARAETGIVGDLEWLGLTWEEGPIRQSERGDAYRAAAERL